MKEICKNWARVLKNLPSTMIVKGGDGYVLYFGDKRSYQNH